MNNKVPYSGVRIRFSQSCYTLGLVVHNNTLYFFMEIFNYPIFGLACTYKDDKEDKGEY